FASASERCARNGYTSRWYHLSCGEHFCNECFDHYYRSHKDGYETFSCWKRVWTSNGKSEPSLKAFMADQQLPYWVQCTNADCRKWRQLSKETQLTAALASSYRCGMKLSSVTVSSAPLTGSDACAQPEDVEVLTLQKCAPHVVVRGLVRIRCVQELDRVLYFMSRKGLINTGALQIKWPLLPESQHNKVLVIGAGAAGLAAARQLQNFGMQVVVLEARERIGGRVWDDVSLGVTVGRGAQIVNGCVNNPIALMCEQVTHTHTLSHTHTHTLLLTHTHIHTHSHTHTHTLSHTHTHSLTLTHSHFSVLHKLAQGLDIRLNTAVQHVDYSGEGVTVMSSCGSRWSAQKVLVTVPLALLQKNVISFSPPLPDRKLKAIHSLGAGVIEKVALQFPTRFWDSKIQGADYFGHIPPCPEKRGLFSVFYDMSPQGEECVLMTVVTGEALSLLRDLQDSQVVDLCMSVLRELFQEQEVPDPLRFLVTRWSTDPWAQMSYSFVKTGGSGEAYDIIAEDMQRKLFFAGEATNRHFPQTVTGAYLSGVREASKIAVL
uniref:Lysine demethylase 1B n=1 Tax=Cyprinus carpio TaxID=7962 RepID=A0A8C2JPZ6_CYPCA